MCEINPKRTKILHLEFFTSHEMTDKEWEDRVAQHALKFEVMANEDGKIRCHVHEGD